MARDDYHVVVYQILSYLYGQLKNGEKINPKRISPDSGYYSINETYWKYIIFNLYNDGYIEGLFVKKKHYTDGEDEIQIANLDKCQITPKGIEYLTDNSFMEKAKEFFKEVTGVIAPFI